MSQDRIQKVANNLTVIEMYGKITTGGGAIGGELSNFRNECDL